MNESWNRRRLLKQLAATSAAAVLPRGAVAKIFLEEPPPDHEIQITSVSENTVRLSVLPVRGGLTVSVPMDGSLAHASWSAPSQKLQRDSPAREFQAGNLQVHVSQTPLVFTISTLNGRQIQRLKIEAGSGVVSFATGNSPLLGLGEGGPQFDRRGSIDSMASGQGIYRLATHGGRVPIPWIISTEGWGMFIHQPFGTLISVDLKVHSGHPVPVPASTSSLSAPPIPRSSWLNTLGLPVTPKCRRCGAWDTSNRIARWAAEKKFSPRPKHFARKNFPAMR